MSDFHLDDEQLSALLDGESDDRAHLSGCATCSARLSAIGGARDAVAAASVPPLAPSVLDELVGAALDASPVAADPAIVPLTRSRRQRTPPPSWLVGVAAALLALVGVAGLVRASGGGSDDAGRAMVTAADRDSGAEESTSDAGDRSKALTAESTSGGGASAPPADPEAVAFDLADQQDPAELGVLLRDLGSGAAQYATDAAASSAATDEAARSSVPTTTTPAAPSVAVGADRAQCRAQAEAAAGDDLGPLLATGRVRWRGQDAEVLVFALRSPPPGVTRQAMVLQRPGCARLAEQRF